MANCSPALDSGDTAFVLFAATAVMLQTPAMGLMQAGLIRRKNALSMIMQTLSGLVIGSLLWFIWGFSLTFGPSKGGIIGNLDWAFMVEVPWDDCFPALAPTIPALLFASFQMMFAIMVPVIVTGAWTEKMTFRACVVFVIFWPILVYYPIAHWVWNPEGWLRVRVRFLPLWRILRAVSCSFSACNSIAKAALCHMQCQGFMLYVLGVPSVFMPLLCLIFFNRAFWTSPAESLFTRHQA